ncbi:MAG TPA: phosphatase PAP2 family protein [Sphingomonas sp.]
MRNLPLIAIALTLGAVATGAPARDGGVSLLSAADLDPQAVLPPPPAAGSAQAVAELAELHAMTQHRSAADIAAAKLEGETKNPTIFAEVLGPKFDLANLPATNRLFDMVRATEKQVVDHGKDEFKRPRPWIADPAIVSCARGEDPLSSYPSGHTSMAFSMAGVLARLVPDKAGPIMARAARYGESRIVCAQHFRSDVTAGEALGLLIAERLMTKPEVRAAFDAARRELAAAGIVRTA